MQVETQLNFQKRKGHGALSVRRPRFSGVQGESLDLSFRWSGDVVCYREQQVILTIFSKAIIYTMPFCEHAYTHVTISLEDSGKNLYTFNL